MYFKQLSNIAYAGLVAWLLWQVAFMSGYQDAVNDLSKKGYSFEQTRRAFP